MGWAAELSVQQRAIPNSPASGEGWEALSTQNGVKPKTPVPAGLGKRRAKLTPAATRMGAHRWQCHKRWRRVSGANLQWGRVGPTPAQRAATACGNAAHEKRPEELRHLPFRWAGRLLSHLPTVRLTLSVACSHVCGLFFHAKKRWSCHTQARTHPRDDKAPPQHRGRSCCRAARNATSPSSVATTKRSTTRTAMAPWAYAGRQDAAATPP